MHDPVAFFVYGTLKRGEEREPLWPHPVLRVMEARTRGLLYDLGPYPAMGDGDGWVGGEVWLFDAEHEAATLQRLDEIECTGADDIDLYERRRIEVIDSDQQTHWAHAYFLVDRDRLARMEPVAVSQDGVRRWSGRE